MRPPPGIDRQVQDFERRLAAARSAAAVEREATFIGLKLPLFDIDAINAVLSRSLADLDAAAVEQVQAHLARLGRRGEQWVAEGVGLIPAASQGDRDEACPFCKQALVGSDIIAHYRAYFGAAYAELREAISDARRAVTATHGGDVPAAFERAVRQESERRQFWSQFAEVPDINIDTAALARAWRAAQETVEAALATKQAAPLEAIALNAAAVKAIDAYHAPRRCCCTLRRATRGQP